MVFLYRMIIWCLLQISVKILTSESRIIPFSYYHSTTETDVLGNKIFIILPRGYILLPFHEPLQPFLSIFANKISHQASQ